VLGAARSSSLPAGIRPLPCPPSSALDAVVSRQQGPPISPQPRCIGEPSRQHRRVEHGVAHRGGRAFVPGDARPPPWTTPAASHFEPTANTQPALAGRPSATQKRHLTVK
jgi:hypothetical protein